MVGKNLVAVSRKQGLVMAPTVKQPFSSKIDNASHVWINEFDQKVTLTTLKFERQFFNRKEN